MDSTTCSSLEFGRGCALRRRSAERVEEFERLRPMLLSIARRIVGNQTDAEDVVQETWLRFAASATEPSSTRAFLVTVARRTSIDLVRTRRRGHQDQWSGPWPLESRPAQPDPYHDPEERAELVDELSAAALLLLERLTPLELAVLVLRGLLDLDFAEIAQTLGRQQPACRQLVVRARRHVSTERARFVADEREHQELTDRLVAALLWGHVDDLCRLLCGRVHQATVAVPADVRTRVAAA